MEDAGAPCYGSDLTGYMGSDYAEAEDVRKVEEGVLICKYQGKEMTVEQEKQFNKEVDMVIFYDMAKRYGFCTPYCECGCKDKPEQFSWENATLTKQRSQVQALLRVL